MRFFQAKPMPVSPEKIRELLEPLCAPASISELRLENGAVSLILTLTPPQIPRANQLQAACETALRAMNGVRDVKIVMTSERAEDSPAARKPAQWNKTPLPYVKKIIAVASGKGGVGKSTTAANLALSLAQRGHTVGVLDADIYGPSQARIFGLSGQPDIENSQMIPLTAHGVKVMSMAFITGDQAAVMRGPMVSKTLHQLLRGVRWGTQHSPLDVLLVDMPPGTGDVALSLAQSVPLDGAIIVTTPQELARIDAAKCAQMFQKMQVPLLGVVENMSYFQQASGEKTALFGQGAGEKLAHEFNTILLGTLPLDPEIGSCADRGISYVENKAATPYDAIVEALLGQP